MANNALELTETAVNTIALEQLQTAINKKNVFAFLGAGCSAKLKYPTWQQLLELLEKAALDAGCPKDDIDIYKHCSEYETDKPWWAEQLVALLSKQTLQQTIQQTFQPLKEMDSKFHRDLMSIPFRHFITTNYDGLLDYAAEKINVPLVHLCLNEKEMLSKFFKGLNDPDSLGARYVIHIHGRYDRPESIILTEKDYIEMYSETSIGYKIIWSIISSFRMCFIGFKLEDFDLLSIFRKSKQEIGGTGYSHFAIINEADVPEKRKAKRLYLRGKYGIDPIFFTEQKDESVRWKEQEDIIADLIKFSSPASKEPKIPKAKKNAASLKKDAEKLKELTDLAKQ